MKRNALKKIEIFSENSCVNCNEIISDSSNDALLNSANKYNTKEHEDLYKKFNLQNKYNIELEIKFNRLEQMFNNLTKDNKILKIKILEDIKANIKEIKNVKL